MLQVYRVMRYPMTSVFQGSELSRREACKPDYKWGKVSKGTEYAYHRQSWRTVSHSLVGERGSHRDIGVPK